ncbi:MAG: alpha-2-macroglobulin family protein [Bacteroidota bacterium]
MKFIKHLPFLVLSVIVISSCGPKKEKPATPDSGFSDYISGFTSGVISSKSDIKIIFKEALNKNQKEKAEDLFKIKPSVKGNVSFPDDYTLIFQPDEPLPHNKRLKISFRLGSLQEVPDSYEIFSFEVQTEKQQYSVDIEGIEAYNDYDLSNQMLKGKITTADFVKAGNLNEFLTAEQAGSDLPVSWTSTADGRTHYFTIDSVKRSKEITKVKMAFQGKAIDADKKISKTYDVPPLDLFKVMQVEVIQEPDQHILIKFSDPLNAKQDLRGLVRTDSDQPLRFAVSGNQLKVFPENRLQDEYLLQIDQALQNTMGYKLDARYQSTITFTTPAPKVAFTGKGNILPSSQNLTLPFKAVSLKAVNVRIIRIFEDNIFQFFQVNSYDGDKQLKRVGRIVFQGDMSLDNQGATNLNEWNTYRLDLSEFITSEPGAIYQVQLNFNRSQSLYNCPEDTEEPTESINPDFSLTHENENDTKYWSWNGFNHVDYSEPYDWKNRDNPCSKAYYMRYNRAVSKNVLASNFGIIAKQGETENLHVDIRNITTTDPVPDVDVQVFNFQKRPVGKATTNGNGKAVVKLDGKGFFVVAKKQNEFGYLRIDDGSSLSTSMFDVGGATAEKGIKGFLYGERNVWRPGDSLFISLMLEDANQVLPAELPVSFELTDPRGRLVSRQTIKTENQKLFVFRDKTAQDAITGKYTLQADLGGIRFTKPIRIETIKPNRLKIDFDFGQKFIYHDDKNTEGTLSVKWLHGAPAANVKADIEMRLASTKTSFKTYENYTFSDPTKKWQPDTKVIFDGRLNEQGTAQISPEITTDKRAPGFLSANFSIRAFEQSGEFSRTVSQIKYSPYSHYVGLKVPEGDGWNGALSSMKKHRIPIASLNEKGEKASRNIIVQVYKINWNWWWENRNNDDLSRFVSNQHGELVEETTIKTVAGEGNYTLDLSGRYWGRLLIRITDTSSGHSAGQLVMMDYPGWWENKQDQAPGGAEMLTFSLNKDRFKTGETAQIKIPSAKENRILVSVENHNKILHSDWIDSKQEFTEYSFEITPEMAPNAYVFVSMVQPHSQTANDRPIRMYGVEPLFVDNPQSHLEPEITMPGELTPEQEVEITVSEKNGHAMQYTLAIVDEGLLDITAFSTPDPWAHFNARRALGVKTWDLYNDVLGAFTGRYSGLLKPGGGVEIDPDAGNQSANRFKPVVKFFGPIKLEQNKQQTHTFRMPNYVGSVRTMLVAAQNQKYGSAETTTPVKKPLMALATAPRTLKPGDIMDVPVTVIAMDASVSDVNIDFNVNEALTVLGNHKQKITFQKPGEKVVPFRVKAREKPGMGTFEVTASDDKETSRYSVELNIVPASPPVTKATQKTLDPGETILLDYATFGIEGTNNTILEASALAPLNLEKRLDYLVSYPHGCLEQIVSGAFPQLYLSSLMNLSSENQKKIQDNINAAIQAISKFHNDNGGFSYWPSSENPTHEWTTSYTGHFLLEAEKKGFYVPDNLITKWLSYQQRASRNFTIANGSHNQQNLNQAYRLYTMALGGEASAGDMNRLREQENTGEKTNWRLAAAYALDGKQSIAEKITGRLSTNPEAKQNSTSTFGSELRDLAMILETMALINDRERGTKLLRDIASMLSEEQWYSTHETAFALLSAAKFTDEMNLSKTINFAYAVNQKPTEKAVTDAAVYRINPDIYKNPEGTIEITNDGEGTLFISLFEKGIPLAGSEEKIRNDLFMDIKYFDMEGNPLETEKIIQGTDIIVETKITHPGMRGDYQNLALTHIMPSGWEIRNQRLHSWQDESIDIHQPDYQDIRDDRIYTYFDLNRNQTKKFRFKVNATYTGKYYLPGISCNAMYDNSIQAFEPGRQIEITKPGNAE